jgi:hypothetical protein
MGGLPRKKSHVRNFHGKPPLEKRMTSGFDGDWDFT